MERLSGLDASFLYIESPTQPLHVCSILELDTSTVPGGYTIDRLRHDLAVRIAAIPEFRAKLFDSQLNLDYPVWVEDDAFDVDRHLLRIGLPSPGGRRELAEICGHIASVGRSVDTRAVIGREVLPPMHLTAARTNWRRQVTCARFQRHVPTRRHDSLRMP
jgi:hypothetical protein